jgi:hypothetical protein
MTKVQRLERLVRRPHRTVRLPAPDEHRDRSIFTLGLAGQVGGHDRAFAVAPRPDQGLAAGRRGSTCLGSGRVTMITVPEENVRCTQTFLKIQPLRNSGGMPVPQWVAPREILKVCRAGEAVQDR